MDLVVLPGTVGSGRLDGDALLALEVHGVHLGADAVAATHLVDLVDAAGVVQDPLRQRRLPGVDVRGDTDIPHPIHGLPPPRQLLVVSPRPHSRRRGHRPPGRRRCGRGRGRGGVGEGLEEDRERAEGGEKVGGGTPGHGHRRLGNSRQRRRRRRGFFDLVALKP